jgi:6-phosphogluconolactonase
MNPEPREIRTADAASQARTLAAAVAAVLAGALGRRTSASLVVAGGHTPRDMYVGLARQPLEWSRMVVALADERWVAVDDPDSNERMVRGALLQHGAAQARYIGLKNDAGSPEEGARVAWAAVRAMPRPFDAVVLGMGEDGHVASLIPGSPGLPAALDVQAPPDCIAMRPPTLAHARVSLNLSALLQSRRIFVQIIGARKWQTYEAACGAGPVSAMPIRAILRQTAVPVEVYWCPDAPAPEVCSSAANDAARPQSESN